MRRVYAYLNNVCMHMHTFAVPRARLCVRIRVMYICVDLAVHTCVYVYSHLQTRMRHKHKHTTPFPFAMHLYSAHIIQHKYKL
jgi:hypothetical protein